VRIKDPTAWVEDLNVYVDDEEVAETEALLKPDLIYSGSKLAAALWLSLVGTSAGAFAAVTFCPGIRQSVTVFAIYLMVALLLLGGLRPATRFLVGRPVVWPAGTTFFWSVLIACCAVLSAGFASAWLAYGLSVGGGFFIAMVHGSLTPTSVKRENEWMMSALALGPLACVLATWASRNIFSDAGAISAAAAVGAIAAGVYSAPMSALLFYLWDEGHGFRHMAVLLLHNDNFAPKAVGYLDAAIARAPADPDLYNLRAIARAKMGDLDLADADWRRAEELAPESAEPLMNRGVSHLEKGDLNKAVLALEAAMARDPGNATVHCNLGVALERRGELDRAIDHYDRAIALRDDYANAYANRGYARFRRGDYEEAVADCERAFELDQLPSALINRGHALKALDRHQAAAESYDAAIDMGLSPALHAEALSALEGLSETRAARVG